MRILVRDKILSRKNIRFDMSSSFQCFHSGVWILFIFFEFVSCGEEATSRDVLLCRQCGHAIVEKQDVVELKSPLALNYKNATVLGPKGILVQTFTNPQGISFDVITTAKANIQTFGEAYLQFSWFPGFAWKIAACPRCQAHLGWAFKPTNHNNEEAIEKYKDPESYSFAGLILSKLIRESFADSLIITPKVYQR